jgi:hypothetical protein
MRIQIPAIDDRSRMAGFDEAVLDMDLDKPVGFIHSTEQANARPSPRVSISLFGGKYTASFETHEECVAFAMGVQAVINHMVAAADDRKPDAG